MNDVLKNAFSKLESKLDYGDQTELTDKEIAFLLRYICEIENKERERKQRIDKALKFCKYLLENDEVVINGKKYYKHECDDIVTNKFEEILKGGING